MRRSALLLLLALLLVGGGYGAGWTGDYRSRIVDGIYYMADLGAGVLALFDAPLNTNGLTATWAVTGVATPDVIWDARCPTGPGAGCLTTHAFTASGSPTSIDAPFCPDGSFDDLTSGCMVAMRFDGTNDYYTSTATNLGPTGDFSYIAIVRRRADASGNDFVWGIGSAAAPDNVEAYISGSYIVTSPTDELGASNPNVYNTVKPDGWIVAGYSFDADAGQSTYMNGDEDNPEAHGLAQSVTPTGQGLVIGADNTGTNKGEVDVVLFALFNTILDDTDMVEVVNYFTGILDNKGAPVAFTNTGPNCCVIGGALGSGGQIECFGDDWPMIGCALPDTGTPASGFYSGEALTNSLPYSRDLDSWTDVGTPVPTATSTDLFRDGRGTYRICDDAAGAVEGIASAAIDVSALGSGDSIAICIYAKDSSGTKIDIQTVESGVCAGSTENWADITIGTSWSAEKINGVTLQDGTCTDLVVRAAPTDWATVVETGCAEFAMQVFKDQDWCPPIYIETEATAVGAGDDVLEYTITSQPEFLVSTMLPEGTIIDWDIAFVDKNASGSAFQWEVYGGGTDMWRLYGSSGTDYLYLYSAEGTNGVLWQNGAVTYTSGQVYEMQATLYSDGASEVVSRDGTPLADASPEVDRGPGPNDLTTFFIGVRDTDANQIDGWISNVQVTQ